MSLIIRLVQVAKHLTGAEFASPLDVSTDLSQWLTCGGWWTTFALTRAESIESGMSTVLAIGCRRNRLALMRGAAHDLVVVRRTMHRHSAAARKQNERLLGRQCHLYALDEVINRLHGTSVLVGWGGSESACGSEYGSENDHGQLHGGVLRLDWV